MKTKHKICFLFLLSFFLIFTAFMIVGLCLAWIDSNTLYICFATMFSGIGAIVLGYISLYNEQTAFEKRIEYEQEKDRNDVRPLIHFSIIPEGDLYVMRIKNYSSYIAINVFVYNCVIAPLVKGNGEISKEVTKSLLEEYCPYEIESEYYPSTVELFYTDIHSRVIKQEFRLRQEDYEYESSSEDIKYITI